MARRRVVTAIADVGFGLDLSKPPIAIGDGWLQDALNVRIKRDVITNEKVGWVRTAYPTLNGPVMMIETYRNRAGVQKTVFATYTDLYQATSSSTVAYITPRYATGTVDVSAANPAVVTDASGPPTWVTNGIKAGDQIHFGNAAQSSISATWYTIATVDAEDQLTLTGPVVGAPLAGQAYTIRKLFSGDSTDMWDSAMWIDTGAATDYLYITNGKERIVRWDGSATAVTYSAATFTARHLCVYSNMLIFGDLTQSGNTLPADIINSTTGNPENTTTGLASQFKVHGGVDPILHMRHLGDYLVIYSGPILGNVVLAQFVGDPLVFVFREVTSDMGPISARVVADYGDYHEFIGLDQTYKFDGAAFIPSGTQVWQKFVGLRDPSRQYLAFHALIQEQGETIWALPLPEDDAASIVAIPQTAFVEHYIEPRAPGQPEPYSRRSFPFLSRGFEANVASVTWDEMTDTWDASGLEWDDTTLLGAFPKPIVGDQTGATFYLYQTHMANGAHLDSFAHFGRRVLNDGVERGLVARIYPFARPIGTPANLDVLLHLYDSAHGDATIAGPFPFDLSLPEGGFFVTPYRRGRFAEVEFQMTEDGIWEIVGYDWKLGNSRGIR